MPDDLLAGGAAAPASAPASIPAAAPADTPAPATTDTPTAGATDTPPAAAAKPTIDDTLRAAWDKLNPKQGRDAATGRYTGNAPAADATDPAAAADGAAATDTTTSTDQPAEPAPGTAPTPSTIAPNSWSAEMKAKWATVPPDVQGYVAQREAEAHQAITRAGEQIKTFEPIRNVIERFGDTFQRNNLQPHDGIARMLAVEDMLATDAPAAIKTIAQAYGVDLAALTGQPPAAPGAAANGTTQPDPAVAAIQKQLADTQAELRQVTSHLTAQQRQQLAAKQAAEQAENDALARQIADFANEQKDGKPARPHYHAVRQHMSALLMTGAATTLQDAYDQAINAHPEIRKLIQADQARADEARRAEEARKKAAEAKRAGALNVRSTPAAGNSPKSVDDTLRETAARLFAQ